jgi:hypothetical protein
MAQIQRLSQLRDVLYLYGSDVVSPSSGQPGRFTLNRGGIKQALFSDTNGVGNFRGHVDFMICYVVNGLRGDFSGVDHSPIHDDPANRPLRGIIQLPKDLGQPMSNESLGAHLAGGIGHETGHYWLVPGRARIRISGEEVDTPTSDDIAASLNNGRGIPRVPIMGRGDSHWSPFIHSEGSFMDGIDHPFPVTNLFTQPLFGYSSSTGVGGSGVTFDFENEEISTNGRFSDLELFLMGLPPIVGTPEERRFQVIEPHWVFPLPFHAGLYIELENGQTWYHGFYRRLDQIYAESVNASSHGSPVWLTDPFDPYNRVALRVVQQGTEVELQVRVWEPQHMGREGCIYWIITKLGGRFVHAPSIPPDLTTADILSDPQFSSADDVSPHRGWRRVTRLPSKATRVGLAARHTDSLCFARMKPKLLCLLHNNESEIVTQQDMVLENEVQIDDASWGSTVLNDGSLVLPYRVGPNTSPPVLLHSDQEDKAPRLVMDAPPGDFVFGGEIELSQCLIVNWAGRAGRNRQYIGLYREVAFADVNYLANWGAEYESVRQAEPHGGAYRFLFCLVSENALEDTEMTAQLTELDRIRRAWMPCFGTFTSGRRGATTEIPFP